MATIYIHNNQRMNAVLRNTTTEIVIYNSHSVLFYDSATKKLIDNSKSAQEQEFAVEVIKEYLNKADIKQVKAQLKKF
jgi:hypothetical protein